MKGLCMAVLAVVLAGTMPPRTIVQEFEWAELEGEGKVVNGTVVRGEGGDRAGCLVVRNEKGEAAAITILTVEDPGITEATYALCGEVSYGDVEGQGCIEMWSHFADGSHFFSRTLALSGPLQSLSGSSDWRPFILPFFIKDDPRRPEKLVVNVVLPGKGKVSLGTIRLVEYAKGEVPLAVGGAWWSGPVGGIIGGAFGVAFGCLGGILGWLSHKGKARAFVVTTVKAMFVIGVGALALAVAALVCGQPYAVYYPPLLVGILLTILPLALLSVVRKLLPEQAELRKMEALDAP